MRRSTLIVAFLFGAAGCDRGMSPDLDADGSPLAASDPISLSAAASSGRVPGRFVVTLEPRANARDVARAHGVEPDFVYTSVMSGFAGSISEAARTGLLRDARVVRIDPDQVFSTDDAGTQSGAPWGLDRIDQVSASLDGRFAYPGTGRGVRAYVVDGGINYRHRDFGGRARAGYDAFGGDGSDCRGHGTHVAGTVGGTVYGVAKELELVSVRVLDCAGAGTTSTVLGGLDWIVANAVRPAVVNMSLSGDPDEVVDAAVRRTIAAGIPVVVAAGNRARDACLFSPSRVPEAVTVGATDQSDRKPYFSNFGRCIDIYAPGMSILSASIGNDTASALMNGTSMASPHVAGAIALLLGANPGSNPNDVAATLGGMALQDAVIWEIPVGDLLQVGVSIAPPVGVNAPPIAGFAPTCTERSCTFADSSYDPDGNLESWRWTFGDGTSSSEKTPSHVYAADGSYTVSLTVTDAGGASASRRATVSVAGPAVVNKLPTPEFSASCMRLECEFVDFSHDADGRISTWTWTFGDGSAATALAAAGTAHVYPVSGTFLVTLAVTDDVGGTSTTTKRVSVGVMLSVTTAKVKGRSSAELRWTGATTGQVRIMVGDATAATTSNTGTYTYKATARGQSTYQFQVCEDGLPGVCSAVQTVSM